MKSRKNFLQSLIGKERYNIETKLKRNLKNSSWLTKKELKEYFKSYEFKLFVKEFLRNDVRWNLLNSEDYINSEEFNILYNEYMEEVEKTSKNYKLEESINE